MAHQIPSITLEEARQEWGDWTEVDRLLRGNPRARWLCCYRVLDFWASRLGEQKVVLVGPRQTIKTLVQAAKVKLDVESIGTTKWPVWYLDNPYYNLA